jgi:hypothetical protein
LQRALLCFGDYLINYAGKRWTFLNTTKDRDTTFKRLLLNADKSKYLKQLLDSLNLEESIPEQLSRIIHGEKPTTINDWRKPIIENGHILKSIGNYKLLEYQGDDNQIINLITGNNNGWKYAELNTFDLYLKIFHKTYELKYDDKEWKIDYFQSSTNEKSCMVFNKNDDTNQKVIDIHYENYNLNGYKYRVSLFCKKVFNNERKLVLDEFFKEKILDFYWVENDFDRFVKFYDNVPDCLIDIQNLIN